MHIPNYLRKKKKKKTKHTNKNHTHPPQKPQNTHSERIVPEVNLTVTSHTARLAALELL